MKFDTLIMTTPADFDRLKHLYPRIAQALPNGRLIFVGSSDVVQRVEGAAYDADITAIDENTILPFDDVHACMRTHMADILQGEELPRGITGWYYQQFLKLAYARQCKDAYYMTWDGDTIPCRPVTMFKEGTDTPFFDLKHEEHAEYFETMGRLIPGMEKVIGRSFISEHMLFQKEFCLELTSAIEANDSLAGTAFWEKIIHAIPAGKIQSSAFSEFETYGTFVALRHVNAYRLREWHSFRLGGEFFDPDKISERDFEWLAKDFDAISFEKNMTVREDHKNLFDNPDYQRKMTPRQMLEAAQKEFQDGYLEVWETGNTAKSHDTVENANRTAGAFGLEKASRTPAKLRYLAQDTWRIYAEMGEILLDANIDQAYLCYENALFLYEEDNGGAHKITPGGRVATGPDAQADTVRESLTQCLQMLEESGSLTVRKTAIVVLSYNQSYLMEKCLDSIRAHCNPDACHVTVLDNASTDGVADYLKEQDDITLLLSDENLGFPKGCNTAVSSVYEDADILFLNNDTRMTPNALFWLRMALYENEETGAAGCMANYTDPSQRIDIEFPLPEDYVKYGAQINVPADTATEARDKLSGFALLVKRPVWDKTGPFDEAFSPGYFEDTDLCLRIRKAGYRLMLCRNSFIYHAGSQSFVQQGISGIEALFTRNYRLLCEKWGADAVARLFPDEEDEEYVEKEEVKEEAAGATGETIAAPETTGETIATPETTGETIAAPEATVSARAETAADKDAEAERIHPADIRLIIWDLDDTFWQGTISEEGVTLNENAVRLARLAPALGIQNSICSKNDLAPVREALTNSPQGNLWELFVFPSVNWDAKGGRIRQTVEDMGLRAENVLFIDDSVFNLEEAAHALPGLMTALPSVVDTLLAAISEAGIDTTSIPESGIVADSALPALITFPDGRTITTDPSCRRLAHYRVLEKKRKERTQASSNEAFLRASDIHIKIDHNCLPHIDRIAELVARTNQLNYTKRRDPKEALESLLAADDVSCAVIHARDRYGDYGIVGFYALDLADDVLLHFLFSCRTLGMGVEQFVYQRLGYPLIDVTGEIARPLEKKKTVTWITVQEPSLNAEADIKKAGTSDSQTTDTQKDFPVQSGICHEKDIFLKGPCDMDQMLPFLKQDISLPLYLETNFVDERGVIVAGNNNLLHLREAVQYSIPEIKENLQTAPFLSLDDFTSDMFSKTHSVVFFSMLSETHAGVYRNKQTGFRICFGSCNFDLTNPANAAAYISGEYPNHNFPFTEEILARFRDEYEFEGSQRPIDIVSNVVWLRETLPADTTLVLLLGSEIEAEENTAEFALHAPKHEAVNGLIRHRFGNAGGANLKSGSGKTILLNFTDFITGQDCFAGCTNHFSRKVYRDVAKHFATLIKAEAHPIPLPDVSHRIAFIICVNDEQLLSECSYYINRLYVPDGFSTEIIMMRNEESITDAYQKAMEQSDAKYKIYLHQDTFLIHRNMLHEMLNIFKDSKTGMIGTFGGSLQKDADIHHYRNRGITLNATYSEVMEFDFRTESEHRTEEVEALDGLFIATQYDLPWDTRMKGWHMYDIAQCIRFREQGYRVCVLNKGDSWTLHDSGYCSEATYNRARRQLCDLYPSYFTYADADREMLLKDMDPVYQREILDEILAKEAETYGATLVHPLTTPETFIEQFRHTVYLLRRMEFGMPSTDWIVLKELVLKRKISVAHLMTAIARGTFRPETMAERVEALLADTDPTVLFFDQFQRYHTAAALIRKVKALIAEKIQTEAISTPDDTHQSDTFRLHLLEVGANEHRDLGKELPEDEIDYTDLHLPESMRYDNHCFTADATDLKDVADNAYDICIAMDVFEHIPADRRARFLTELYRVCKYGAVICFPYNAPEVAAAEQNVNEMYYDLYGEAHPWLIEHIENGLPDREKVERVLRREGIRFTAFTHGNVALWQRMIVMNFFVDEEAFNEAVSDANLYYNRNLYEKDSGEVNYRIFYVLEKAPEIAGKITDPFAGKSLTDEDIAPIDRVLEHITG